VLNIVILAAGKGSRMRSNLPKVMHSLAGEPILSHVIDTASQLITVHGGQISVVTGHGRDEVDPLVTQCGCRIVHQDEQCGTGHALALALQGVDPDSQTLVLYGDVPLIRPEHLEPLLIAGASKLSVLTARLDDPTGYGRISRDDKDRVIEIVEHKDASPAQRAIKEINSGIYAAPTALFQRLLPQITNENAQGEYYLTDCIALSVSIGSDVTGVEGPTEAVMGINDRAQLAAMEQKIQMSRRLALMQSGVTMVDPDTVYIQGAVEIAPDVIIQPHVVLVGPIQIREDVEIGFGCHLTNVEIGAGTVLKPYSVLESVVVGQHASIGPFARLRPGTVLDHHTHIGNFVETKNTHIGLGSKVNHLSYVGDADLGQRVNVGAGTITCNYDGANKHRTTLGDDVFIGSNTSLVAPVQVGHGATTGAGSVITREVLAGELAISRAPQHNKAGYLRPTKTKE
jgi:bifunctional UDP-N-acetylglucosamine pyrophosphorylase / glucosamine-1-phosphate N-acetyltransferase